MADAREIFDAKIQLHGITKNRLGQRDPIVENVV